MSRYYFWYDSPGCQQVLFTKKRQATWYVSSKEKVAGPNPVSPVLTSACDHNGHRHCFSKLQ